MRDKFRRAAWAFMALTFIITGLGVGIYAFWQSTRQDNANQSPIPPQGKKLENFKPIDQITSLKIIDLKNGTGKLAKTTSSVSVHYVGALASSGVVFESSKDNGRPVTLALSGNLIDGWKEGVPGMRVGGERRLLIPAKMAYGLNPPLGSIIPPNANLVFDITLLCIK